MKPIMLYNANMVRLAKLSGLLFVVLLFWTSLSSSIQAPNECHVSKDHQTIQSAIDDSACNTILIAEGTYQENLRIDRRDLTLRPEHPDANVIVESQARSEPAVLLTNKAQGVQIIGLTLKAGKHGLQALGSKNLSLFNLILDNNEDTGLFLVGVESGELLNSQATGNGTGVFLVDRTAFRLTDNLIEGNVQCGLQADEQSVVTGANNTIFGNGGGELCGGVVGRQDLLDQRPPEAPLKVKRKEPESWTNQDSPRVVIDWDNPDEDAESLAAFWFKLGDVPTHPTDGTRMPIGQKPLTMIVANPLDDGQIPVYVWLEDKMGNVTHKNRASVPLLIDRTPPTIQPDPNRSPSPPANANGWNNTDVAVFFDCEDPLWDPIPSLSQGSGIKSCTESVVKKKEGKDLSATGDAEDNAGNKAEPATVKVSIDKGTPTIRSFKVASGAKKTPSINVKLNIEFNDKDKLSSRNSKDCTFDIRFANAEEAWKDWEEVTATAKSGKSSDFCTYQTPGAKLWLLPQPRGKCKDPLEEDPKVILVQARDLAGNESQVLATPILLACTARVPGDFSRIQDAIDSVPDNATILLVNPTYTENLTIDKPLKLQGVGEQPVLKGKVEGQPVIRIESSSVTIDNVTIAEAKGLTEGADGIQTRGNAKLTLTNVRISNNGDDGLEVGDSAKVDLDDSTVSDNGGDGLQVGSSTTVRLSNTQISNNGDDGLKVGDKAKLSLENATIFSNNDDGLEVGDSAEATLAHSTVSSNGGDGLEVGDSASAGVNEVTIEGNGTDPRCSQVERICNGLEVWDQAQVVITDSIIRNNLDWGVAAKLQKCGYPADFFTGIIDFQGLNVIVENGQGDVCVR